MPMEKPHDCDAMVCDAPGAPLRSERRAIPVPGPREILVEVHACGVCRTDLHVVDGEIPARYPVVPGHEVVGTVLRVGTEVIEPRPGTRVGIAWLGRTCGRCAYCRSNRENLCDAPEFTGATRDGGYATHMIADADFVFPLPGTLDPIEAAPLMCAGLIGWRAFRAAGQVRTLGLFGFGAAAHILAQVARARGARLFAFTREGDDQSQSFARLLGCEWAGSSRTRPDIELDAAIIFAPVGELVPTALRSVRKGGRIICAGIHMSDVPGFPYTDLWGERRIESVANLTRADGHEFLNLDTAAQVRTQVTPYPLAAANAALDDLRRGRLQGAAVLVP